MREERRLQVFACITSIEIYCSVHSIYCLYFVLYFLIDLRIWIWVRNFCRYTYFPYFKILVYILHYFVLGSQSVEARIASRLADIKRAYASKVDSQNYPVSIKLDTAATKSASISTPSAAPQASPPPVFGSFAFGGAAAATPGSTTLQSSLNRACEFETFMYDPAKMYEKNPYKRPQHVNSRQWLQVSAILLDKSVFQ